MTRERRLTFLTVTNLVLLVALGVTSLAGFAGGRDRLRLEELDVERINVLGENGQPVMVIARRGRLPGAMADGRWYPPGVTEGREHLSGMLFFTETGDEIGSLIYNSLERPDGTHSTVAHLSFDQWKQNQTIALQHIDNGRRIRSGIQFIDRPTDVPMSRELDRLERMLGAEGAERDSLRAAHRAAQAAGAGGTQRIFLGSDDRDAVVQLRDTSGRIRAQLRVDKDGTARLEFLDEAGTVTARYPEG